MRSGVKLKVSVPGRGGTDDGQGIVLCPQQDVPGSKAGHRKHSGGWVRVQEQQPAKRATVYSGSAWAICIPCNF